MKTTLTTIAISFALTSVAHAQGAPAKAPAAAAQPAKDAKAAAPAAPAAPAAAAPPAGPPTPAPEMDQLKPYAGNWKCDGKQNESPMGPGHVIKAKMTVKRELGGFFDNVRWEESKAKDNPMPVQVQIYAGYDAAKKAIMRSDMDSFGGMGHFTAAPWEGDKHVWTGQIMTPMGPMEAKHTWTKKSDKELASVFEVKGKDGAWMTWSEWTCKK